MSDERTGWPSDPEKRAELERALDEGGCDELPPNVPPGLLGEAGPDLRKTDSEGPHGLNAGVTQEWTWELTVMAAVLATVVFFPAAYVIVWRSRILPRRHKLVITVLVTIVVAAVAWGLVVGQ